MKLLKTGKVLKKSKKIMVGATVVLAAILIALGIAGKVSVIETTVYSVLILGICGFVVYKEPKMFIPR